MNTMKIFAVNEVYGDVVAYFTTAKKAEAFIADEVAKASARYTETFGADDKNFNSNLFWIDEVEVM